VVYGPAVADPYGYELIDPAIRTVTDEQMPLRATAFQAVGAV